MPTPRRITPCEDLPLGNLFIPTSLPNRCQAIAADPGLPCNPILPAARVTTTVAVDP